MASTLSSQARYSIAWNGSNSPNGKVDIGTGVGAYSANMATSLETSDLRIIPETNTVIFGVYAYSSIVDTGSVDVATSLSNVESAIANFDVRLSNVLSNNTVHITETWRSGTEWYRKYSDGWIEQGGRIAAGLTGTQTVSLIVPYTTTDYAVLIGSDGTYYKQEHWEVKSQTTTSFSTAGWTPAIPQWYACGF